MAIVHCQFCTRLRNPSATCRISHWPSCRVSSQGAMPHASRSAKETALSSAVSDEGGCQGPSRR
eukprot:7195302-Lingulodinium_polyedra.AAC.1